MERKKNDARFVTRLFFQIRGLGAVRSLVEARIASGSNKDADIIAGNATTPISFAAINGTGVKTIRDTGRSIGKTIRNTKNAIGSNPACENRCSKTVCKTMPISCNQLNLK